MLNIKNANDLLKAVEKKYLKKIENIKVGDIVKLGYIISEANKEKVQFHEGIVICIQNKNLGKSFTIRKTIEGIGVEENFPIHSPKISSIKIKQNSHKRRAKLYFLRKLSGKAARLKRKIHIK